jgi:hypothetical protein
VVAAAPVAFPFIVEDRVVLGVYVIFALGALVWTGLALKKPAVERLDARQLARLTPAAERTPGTHPFSDRRIETE